MAKKKTTTQLTDEQIAGLVPVLLGSRSNIYDIARRMGCEADDSTFDRLEKSGAKRCCECDVWQDQEEEFEKGFDTCTDCLNSIDGEDE